MPPRNLPLADLKAFFRRQFGYTPPQVAQAPGRMELLGNHTDEHQGLVMSAAVNHHTYMAAATRTDGRIEVASSAFPHQKEKFWLSTLEKNPAAPWADPVKAVLRQLRQRRVHFTGFTAAYHSTIPIGAGLGSSGALMAATAVMIRQLFPHQLTETGSTIPPKRLRNGDLPPLTPKQRLLMAQVCHEAKSHFIGPSARLLDPITSLLGKEFHLVQTDFLHTTVERTPLIGEVALIWCDSGTRSARAAAEIRQRRELCAAATRALGAKSLRAVEPQYLATHKRRLSEREHACAYHIVGENQRVIFADRALREGDFVQFGQYLFQSHESSRDFYRNSTPELDLLVELAREHPGCLGARLTGQGFGGATISLVHWTQAEAFMKYMAEQYEKHTGHPLTPVRMQMVDGADTV